MTNREFDEILAVHCSPALAGIKCANLITISKQDREDVLQFMKLYNQYLSRNEISFEVLHDCDTHLLILVYRASLLWGQLIDPAIRKFLNDCGYRHWNHLQAVLDCLKIRCRNGVFPHEIGLFLGYPLEDVIGFIQHKGQNFKICGYWKVYSDETAALRRFKTFNLCRNDFCRRLKRGASILDLFRSSSGVVNHARTSIEPC